MAYVNVNFNNSAQSIIGENPRVRIRVKNGKLQFKPTTRTSDVNLPPGERLRNVTRTEKRVSFSVMEDFLVADKIVTIEKGTYGWHTLNYAEGDYRSGPTAKLSSAVSSSTRRAKKSAKPLDEPNEHVNVP